MASIGSRLAVGADNSLVAVPMENVFLNQGAIASKEALSVGEILTRLQTTYSSLSSYSDEGYVTNENGEKCGTFTMSLARTNFYRIEWELCETRSNGQSPAVQVAWSSGTGEYVKPRWGAPKELPLVLASSFFDNVTATTPLIFFDKPWMDGMRLDDIIFQSRRLPDEKIGGIDCFVCEREFQGKTNTLWIGRRDYLVHQFRTVVSAEAMRGLLAKYLDTESREAIQGCTRTEIHTNLKLNPPLSQRNFRPSIPIFFDDE